MLRKSTSLALVAGFALAFGLAPDAQAGPSIDMIWRQSGTDTVDAATLGGATVVTADVVLTADANAVGGVFISFLFDADGANELDYMSGFELSTVTLGKGNSFSPLAGGLTLDIESATPDVTGVVLGFDQATLTTGLVSNTVTLGSLVFGINTIVADPSVDLVGAVLPNGVDAITRGLDLIGSPGENISGQATFNGAFVPEPAAVVTGAFALAAVAALGFRRRS